MTKLGKYEIVEEIGRGGFSVVYKAQDPTLDRLVALKVLAPHLSWEPTFVEQFHREAKIVARLRHPHIVIVHEIGEEAGQLYIAMEHLRGRTLAQTLSEGEPLSLEQVVTILEQLADALDYAHSLGILHRDLKPSNIMVGEGRKVAFHVTLMDFGLVKAMEGSHYVRSSGRIVGTPEYMSPEQAEGEELDHRSDLYSLGVVVYQMCTEQVPFVAPSPLAVLRGHTDKPPPSPRQLNPQLSAEVEQVLLKALAKKREGRYQSAGAMVRALREAVEAREMLRREQAQEEQEARLARLHEQAVTALRRERWEEAQRRCADIEGLKPGYRDVAKLVRQAEDGLRREQAKEQARKERQAQLAQLYEQAQAALQEEQWEEVGRFCREIEALEPGYRDVGELSRQVNRELHRERAEERQARLAQLYEQLQAAVARDNWAEVQTLGRQIQGLDRNYRDVSELMAQARKHLRRPWRESVPAWGVVGLFILAVLLGVTLGPRLWEAISAPTETPTETPTATSRPVEVPTGISFKAGMVTDIDGIDDKSFNTTSWHGLERAEQELGVEIAYLESRQQTDYAVNITQFLDQDYDIIVTVGFLLGEDTATFAQQNPDTDFAIVDFAYDPTIDNVLGLTFAADEAAFLAGYAAAGMSKTGKVGTFGGIEIPSVTVFMVGFESGVKYYNEMHGTNVEVLGMDLFVGNFYSTDDGHRVGEDLIAEGADIIMPMAGLTGLGTAAAVKENPGTMLIGTDTDWCIWVEEYCGVTLTSVLKNIDVAVFEAIKQAKEGIFEGGVYVGTLKNDGVGIADFHEFDDDVPVALRAELEAVRQGITGGTISTGWGVAEAPPPEEAADTLIIGTTDTVTVLDPADSYDFHTWEIHHNTMDTLLHYIPGTTDLEPGLAAEMPEVSADGLEYTFKLREGLSFPDGAPFNAEAVKWSIDRVIRLEGDPNWLVSSFVDSVEVVDEYTVKFILQAPSNRFPLLVATQPYSPISPDCYSEEEFDADSMCGGIGPYKITRWERDVEMVLEAYDGYPNPPATPKIVVKYYADATTMRLVAESGEIDIATETLNPTDYVDLEAAGQLQVIEGPGAQIRYICFNVTMSPFNDAKVRQAIAYAVDRAAVTTIAFQGTQAPLYSMVPRGIWSHIDAFPERDLAMAKELLAAAGYSEASPLGMDLWWTPAHYGPTEADVATVLKDNLEETGMIVVSLQNAEWATYRGYVSAGSMPVFLLSWYPDLMDPDDYTWLWGHSTAADDMGIFYANDEMDALLEAGQTAAELRGDDRLKIYEDAQELWVEDPPTIPLTQGAQLVVAQPDVTGIVLDPNMLFHYFLLAK